MKAPKGQFNAFGKYKYRSCEDILEAVKPYLGTSAIMLRDEMVLVGERYYIKAIATFAIKEGNKIDVCAFAREPLLQKGMNEAQITGSASSYARKYALNGLLLIDDTKDADTQDNRPPSENPADFARSVTPPQNSDNKYRVPFGKFKGKTLDDLDRGEIASYIQFITKDGEPKGNGAEFVNIARKYLQGE